ncbi:hypothetical protein POM88_033194 [Heracleum sosnowskyi]|uniref:Uncharacterized protein n=1 Tax=Heracleum sosnowskyi TaxID=360622 RepID=A0AAD8I139_9APIA|nr:hypothetical protein POM88_033194 [Heracleum sosnowskyi]
MLRSLAYMVFQIFLGFCLNTSVALYDKFDYNSVTAEVKYSAAVRDKLSIWESGGIGKLRRREGYNPANKAVGIKKKCQEWDSNPRPGGPVPWTGGLTTRPS